MVVFGDVSEAKLEWEGERGASCNHMQKIASIFSYVIASFSLQKAYLKQFLFRVKIKNGKIYWGVWDCVGLGT